MSELTPFKFERTRGIIWVCDIEKSSSFLNDDHLIRDIEDFLPRLYYVSKLIVETYGGKFLKWTGDGFLAFFEVDLERELLKISERVFDAAWHLSFMSNLTQMGLKPQRRINISHGITYERDALLMEIQSNDENGKLDIIGRDVVLAFRIISINSIFPSIATVKRLIPKGNTKFIKWRPTDEEKLSFFKGEKYGLSELMISGYKEKAETDWSKMGERLGKKVAKRIREIRSGKREQLIMEVFKKMENGPDWCQDIIKLEKEPLERLVEVTNKLISSFREIKKAKPTKLKTK